MPGGFLGSVGMYQLAALIEAVSQSRWNDFKIIYGRYRLFIEYNTLIETSSTSLIGFGQNKEERLKYIKSLSDRGLL